MAIFSELLLSDGTTTIDMLALNKGQRSGFGIQQYTPGRAQPKGGGSWQDSPLADGRRLVYQAQGNIQDNLIFRIAYPNAESVIEAQRRLTDMLAKATSYWLSDWQNSFVYLQAIAHGERNRRYAILYGVTLENYPSPYDQPYLGGVAVVMDDLRITFERSHWMANKPDVDTAITVSHSAHDVESPQVVVGNCHTSGLAGIHNFYSVVGVVWESNILATNLPHTLLPDALDDESLSGVAFASNTPIPGIAFNIGTPLSGVTGVWEGSVGDGSWAEIYDVVDGTNGFTEPGLNYVYWPVYFNDVGRGKQQESIYGPYYWVRWRVTEITAPGGAINAVKPVLVDVPAYATTVPYVEVAEGMVEGDLDAHMKLRLHRRNAAYSNPPSNLRQDIYMGLRSLTRAGYYCGDFSAYINPKTADNPVGINVVLNADRPDEVYYEESAEHPTGFGIVYLPVATEDLEEIFRVEIEESIVKQYYGRYRLFARLTYYDTSGQTQLRARIRYKDSAQSVSTQIITLSASLSDYSSPLIDFGYVRLPPTSLVSYTDISSQLEIVVDALGPLDSGGFVVSHLIILPVDEWTAQATGEMLAIRPDYVADIDAITFPKETLRSIMRDSDSLRVIDTFPLIANQDASLHNQTGQRIWFVMMNLGNIQNIAAKVEISVNPQYYNLRSD